MGYNLQKIHEGHNLEKNQIFAKFMNSLKPHQNEVLCPKNVFRRHLSTQDIIFHFSKIFILKLLFGYFSKYPKIPIFEPTEIEEKLFYKM